MKSTDLRQGDRVTFTSCMRRDPAGHLHSLAGVRRDVIMPRVSSDFTLVDGGSICNACTIHRVERDGKVLFDDGAPRWDDVKVGDWVRLRCISEWTGTIVRFANGKFVMRTETINGEPPIDVGGITGALDQSAWRLLEHRPAARVYGDGECIATAAKPADPPPWTLSDSLRQMGEEDANAQAAAELLQMLPSHRRATVFRSALPKLDDMIDKAAQEVIRQSYEKKLAANEKQAPHKYEIERSWRLRLESDLAAALGKLDRTKADLDRYTARLRFVEDQAAEAREALRKAVG